jgi:hypothetical protein
VEDPRASVGKLDADLDETSCTYSDALGSAQFIVR